MQRATILWVGIVCSGMAVAAVIGLEYGKQRGASPQAATGIPADQELRQELKSQRQAVARLSAQVAALRERTDVVPAVARLGGPEAADTEEPAADTPAQRARATEALTPQAIEGAMRQTYQTAIESGVADPARDRTVRTELTTSIREHAPGANLDELVCGGELCKVSVTLKDEEQLESLFAHPPLNSKKFVTFDAEHHSAVVYFVEGNAELPRVEL